MVLGQGFTYCDFQTTATSYFRIGDAPPKISLKSKQSTDKELPNIRHNFGSITAGKT